jgi:phenylpyruvate tautomerase PptA (4-oxalocrotonate tautomerase family)
MAAFDWSAVGRVLDQITSAMSELARQVGEVVAVAVEYIMAADIPGAVARMEC